VGHRKNAKEISKIINPWHRTKMVASGKQTTLESVLKLILIKLMLKCGIFRATIFLIFVKENF